MKDYQSFINSLAKLISFKTVKSAPAPNAPFGKQTADALNYLLDLANSFGLKTINYDNYGGEVILGQGEQVGIIGHIDVVPEGGGWNTDPYTLTEKDGVLYARGVLDDKSGTLACLYALKELKESGLSINRTFRLIIGCNEEDGWKDIDYIKTKTTLPKYGFSPDGNFPLSYAEKGMYELIFSIPKLKNFTDVKGGIALNAVCAYASVTATPQGINHDLLKKHGLSLKNDNVIESFGKSAHGSHPELGENALKPLFNYFLDMGENVKDVVDNLFLDKKNLCALQNEQGFVTFSPDIILQKDDEIIIKVDCRIPAPLQIDDVKKIVDTFGIDYSIGHFLPPVMMQKNGSFIRTLLNAYNFVTGENLEPISLGGSTFARVFECGCAFGPEFPNGDGCCHEANEHVSVSELIRAYDIYKKAIFDLAKGE